MAAALMMVAMVVAYASPAQAAHFVDPGSEFLDCPEGTEATGVVTEGGQVNVCVLVDEDGDHVFPPCPAGFGEIEAIHEYRLCALLAPHEPTAKEQCKGGGYEAFGRFKNQGECVAFVERGPKNEEEEVPS